MKKKIKIKFTDFWSGFTPEKSYFFDLLGGNHELEFSDNPEILFFSNYGNEHKKYKCFKVFFSAENERPNMFKCDIALTFDYKKNKRHFRLPLFVLYLHHYGKSVLDLKSHVSKHELIHWKKRKFCCVVISNGKSKKRLLFLDFLNKKVRVDSGGKIRNNIGGPVKNKLDFIKDYKFVISFENSSHIGYVTEKILEPFLVNSIPIYWGDPNIHKDFNEKSFLNIGSTSEFEDVFNKMVEIDKSEDLALKMLNTSKIKDNLAYLDEQRVRNFIMSNFTQTTSPISSNLALVLIGQFIDGIKVLSFWVKHYTIRDFR